MSSFSIAFRNMSDVSEVSTVVARGRLAVLTAHLVTSTDLTEVVPSLEPHRLSAQTSVVLPPGNLSGSLTVVDGRTSKQYQLPVSEEGTVKATDLKKVYQLCLEFEKPNWVCFCVWWLFMIWLVHAGEIFSKQKQRWDFGIGFWIKVMRVKVLFFNPISFLGFQFLVMRVKVLIFNPISFF